jgi:branched-chain amino acid transport system substrate-binding protein
VGAALTLLAALAAAGNVGSQAKPTERDVVIGGLFSLTGNWSTLGQSARATMEIAVEDLNRYLEGNAAGIRFVSAIEDTRLDPELALEKARALQARGAQILIGPQSSGEVEHLRSFVQEAGLLLVSTSSTAAALAVPGDNIFRFTPTDSLESVAIATLMWGDAVRAVVPVWRQDPGNAGLARATRANIVARGGTVYEGVPYAADTKRFESTGAALSAQVRQAIDRHGAGSVGVYVAAFDEVVHLFAAARADPVLGSVRWYGSDGVALSEALLNSPDAVAFAIKTRYAAPLFGLDEGARDIWASLAERVRARAGREPDAYALAIHDAVWVAARAYVASGAPLDLERLKHAFTTAAASHYGATGWTVLDDAGDRRYGDFDFWGVRAGSGVPGWIRVGRYAARTGLLVR